MFVMKKKFIELLFELPIFMLLAFIHGVLGLNEQPDLDDLAYMIGLWGTALAFRFIFLQIPICWLFSYFYIAIWNFKGTIKSSAINFCTFIFVFLFSSQFSIVISGFMTRDLIFLPIFLLISTTLSPFLNWKNF